MCIAISEVPQKVFEVIKQINDMPKVIEVIYEDGVFKPLGKVDLKEGEKLKIEIKREPKLEMLKGKYKGKIDIKAVMDEIYDRRTHFY
jgi:predicted DNA-binding antitoxin AbrB/MazE fold protein